MNPERLTIAARGRGHAVPSVVGDRNGRGRRRTGLGGLAAVAAVAAATVLAGCAGDARSAQDKAVVPADAQVAGERADKARAKGSEDAPIQIVEISDFQCPFCAQFYEETLGALDSLYIATGKASYLWISYASPGHARAWPAIEASFCAGAVGLFWPMHDILFERREEWSSAADPSASFAAYADELGIDAESFASCVRNDLLAPLMLRDYTSVLRAGISSTPYFVIDSVAIRGAAPLETFTTQIDALLALRDGSGESEEN